LLFFQIITFFLKFVLHFLPLLMQFINFSFFTVRLGLKLFFVFVDLKLESFLLRLLNLKLNLFKFLLNLLFFTL